MSFVTQAEVIEIIEHSTNVREYTLSLDKERKYNPGSFVQLTLDIVTASDIWPDSRTFSIASYDKGSMKFIIKNVGEYTSQIFEELKVGDKCTIKYPFGELFNKNLVDEKHLFIAGGIGITPYLGLVKYYNINNKVDNISLFYSAKKFGDLLYHEELKQVLGDKLEVFVTQEEVTSCHKNRIKLEDIKRAADKETNIYLCGSKEFNNDYKAMLIEHKYIKVHVDEWD